MSDNPALVEVNDLFISRCQEVDRYLKFLISIEDSRANALAHLDGEDVTVVQGYEITRELIKTMRANGYLLLYNLVESTMTNSVDAIHKSFVDSGCGFDDLNDQLKKILLNNFRKFLDKSNQAELNGEHPIQHLIVFLGYDKQRLFSGNLDAREIKTTARKYGFQIAEHDFEASRDGSSLLKVKTKRNELAHGHISFEECGHETSPDELVRIFNETEVYLTAVLKGIEDYIVGCMYRCEPLGSTA